MDDYNNVKRTIPAISKSNPILNCLTNTSSSILIMDEGLPLKPIVFFSKMRQVIYLKFPITIPDK